MIKGSCSCGSIRFELTETPSTMGTCHCARCRKIGAGPQVLVRSESFRITKGEDKIAVYTPESSYNYYHCFCSVCGSALGEFFSREREFPIAAHCIDEKEEIKVEEEIHDTISEKLSLYHIREPASQYYALH